MESQPRLRYIPQKSKKRVFPGSSSSCMDPDVVEISAPVTRSSHKQKEVMNHEVIDIDMDEDSADVMFIDEKFDMKNKGKEVLTEFSNGHSGAENPGSVDGMPSDINGDLGPHNSINMDGHISDLSYNDDEYLDMYYDDLMYDDEYTLLQAHFDNIDIPPGIEAPIPWLSDPAQNKNQSTSSAHLNLQNQPVSTGLSSVIEPCHSMQLPKPIQNREESSSKWRSTMQTKVGASNQSNGDDVSLSWSLSESVQDKKNMAVLMAAASMAASTTHRGYANLSLGLESFRSWSLPESSHSKKKLASSSTAARYSSRNRSGSVKLPHRIEPHSNLSKNLQKQVGDGSLTYSSLLSLDTMNLPPAPVIPDYWNFYASSGPVHTFPEEEPYSHWLPDPGQINDDAGGSSTNLSDVSCSRANYGNQDDILRKFQLFKQFDTVQDCSDHRYSSNKSLEKQPSKNWAKKIQDEWKILQKDLPETIFVRAYESRMDLLRAVVVGAEGTPYHDGLFFFDIFFPCNYPNVPPHVYYHSGGLRINPNLYNCGKVCLSLLNTWSGNQNEKWIPGLSTMLQVLVSIQALVLNAKPYFNEPGYACTSGSKNGEKSSQQYNENTFILSLKTMIYHMRKPPKNFEDLVVGHFCSHAHDILVACKAYMDGAQVGCLAKGGVQDVDAGDKSCSQHFKANLAAQMKTLVQAFRLVGAKDCEKFLPPEHNGNKVVPPLTQRTANCN